MRENNGNQLMLKSSKYTIGGTPDGLEVFRNGEKSPLFHLSDDIAARIYECIRLESSGSSAVVNYEDWKKRREINCHGALEWIFGKQTFLGGNIPVRYSRSMPFEEAMSDGFPFIIQICLKKKFQKLKIVHSGAVLGVDDDVPIIFDKAGYQNKPFRIWSLDELRTWYPEEHYTIWYGGKECREIPEEKRRLLDRVLEYFRIVFEAAGIIDM